MWSGPGGGPTSEKQRKGRIPTGTHQRHTPTRLDGPGQEGGDSEGTGRLDDEFRAEHGVPGGIEECLVVDADNVFDALPYDGEVALADGQSARAVGDGLRRVNGHDPAALERLLAVVAGARLDAVDAQARLDGRPREGRAGEQPSSAEGRDDGLDLGPILHDLEGDGPGAGDDPFVVAGGDDGRAALCCALT